MRKSDARLQIEREYKFDPDVSDETAYNKLVNEVTKLVERLQSVVQPGPQYQKPYFNKLLKEVMEAHYTKLAKGKKKDEREEYEWECENVFEILKDDPWALQICSILEMSEFEKGKKAINKIIDNIE